MVNFIRSIKRAWRLHKTIRRIRCRKRGYDWAMSAMTSDLCTPEQIYNWCDDPFEGRDEYDRGALAAVYIFELYKHDVGAAICDEREEKEKHKWTYL